MPPFNRRVWRLEHHCTNSECPWPDPALPFFIVDEEIYRHLPTIVVGTLDKVASISMQAAMRGFVASPHGLCSEDGHGFVYARRGDRPNGCLVPGCRGMQLELPMVPNRFPPTFRLQDELHLLRDSLGASMPTTRACLTILNCRSAMYAPKSSRRQRPSQDTRDSATCSIVVKDGSSRCRAQA